ncbi:hypothetical protein [Pseudomonas syringae]|nr:hypothetical protein [Pseudomonas syringae]
MIAAARLPLRSDPANNQLGMLRSTGLTAAASHNFLSTQRYLQKIE